MKQKLLLSMFMLTLTSMPLTAKVRLVKKVTVTTAAHVGGIVQDKNANVFDTTPCFCTNVGSTYIISTLGADRLTTLAEITLGNNDYKLKPFQSFTNSDDKLAGIWVDDDTDEGTYLFCFTTNTSYETGNTIIVNKDGKVLYSGVGQWFYYSSELECIGIGRADPSSKEQSTYTFIPTEDFISGTASNIEGIEGDNSANAKSRVYNLQGMEVDKNTKGIIIKDGNAILNK